MWKSSTLRRIGILLIDTLLLVLFLGVHYLYFNGKEPPIQNAQLRMEGADWEDIDIPFHMPTQEEYYELSFDMYSSWFYPQFYQVHVDDCLEELRINDIPVLDEELYFCGEPRTVDYRPYVHHGWNHMYFKIRDTGGVTKFWIRSVLSTRHPIVLGLNSIVLVVIFSFVGLRLLR